LDKYAITWAYIPLEFEDRHNICGNILNMICIYNENDKEKKQMEIVFFARIIFIHYFQIRKKRTS
jgi:hypothetical protein